jgi:hypothetical protein
VIAGAVSSASAAGGSVLATTTKSAASHVNGCVFRRSLERRSTGADSLPARLSSLRRSHEIATAKSAVLRTSASNRRCAPLRTIMSTSFFLAMHSVVSVLLSLYAGSPVRREVFAQRHGAFRMQSREVSGRTVKGSRQTRRVSNRSVCDGQPVCDAKAVTDCCFRWFDRVSPSAAPAYMVNGRAWRMSSRR